MTWWQVAKARPPQCACHFALTTAWKCGQLGWNYLPWHRYTFTQVSFLHPWHACFPLAYILIVLIKLGVHLSRENISTIAKGSRWNDQACLKNEAPPVTHLWLTVQSAHFSLHSEPGDRSILAPFSRRNSGSDGSNDLHTPSQSREKSALRLPYKKVIIPYS